jgi:hypothetical protein
LLGQGDGSFKVGSITPINASFPLSFEALGGLPEEIALADFNGDGNLDVVTANPTPGFSASSISVLLGNGDGTFRETSDANVGVADVNSVAVGDFNNDHIPDLVVNGFFGVPVTGGIKVVNGVSVLLGNGDGTFQAPQLLVLGTQLGAQVASVAVGDFNRDGNLDIVTGSFGGTVSVLLGNGNGTFQAPLNFSTGVGNPAALAVADFNHDGFPDLAVTDFFSNFVVGNSVKLLLNSGTWPAPATMATVSTNVSSQPANVPPLLTGSATPASQPANPAALSSSASAPSQAANPSSAVLFWAGPTAADQLFAGLGVEDQIALWFSTPPPSADDWADAAFFHAFLDPFKKR